MKQSVFMLQVGATGEGERGIDGIFGLDLGFIDYVNTRLVITLYRSLTHTD
jgi:hypothetical protein